MSELSWMIKCASTRLLSGITSEKRELCQVRYSLLRVSKRSMSTPSTWWPGASECSYTVRSSSALKRSGAENTTPSSRVTVKLATRASLPCVSTTTRTLLANSVVVSADTRLLSVAMSPSSLSYSAGSCCAPPSANSLASGFSGDGLVSSPAPAALAGGGPPRSSLPTLDAGSDLSSALSTEVFAGL